MAPKRANAAAPVAAPATTVATPSPAAKAPKSGQNWDQVVANLVNYYNDSTPQRTKLLDVFMAFLVTVGALQFVYCVVAGNYVRRYTTRFAARGAACSSPLLTS